MDVNEIIESYPRLYHMAASDSWDRLKAHGLRSTSSLLDLFEITGAEREAIESTHRPRSVTITHPQWGTAEVRDQLPLNEAKLLKCLRGVTPREWYELLNGKTYFWLTYERVLKLLCARAYRGRIHTVLTVDSASLVRAYASDIRLSPINSGQTLYEPRPRGRDTFYTIADYPFAARRRARRGVANAIAELTIEGGVPDIERFVLRVDLMRDAAVIETLYER